MNDGFIQTMVGDQDTRGRNGSGEVMLRLSSSHPPLLFADSKLGCVDKVAFSAG